MTPERADAALVAARATGCDAAKPILIVGSPRSGTSVLVEALREGAGIQGAYEGHLLPLLNDLLDAVDVHYKRKADLLSDHLHLIATVSRERLHDEILDVFRRLYAERHEGDRWLDKTADDEMIMACPAVLRAWPRSRFVFARRNGLGNVASRLRKFPEFNFRDHCRYWAASMHRWHELREQLNGQYIEIDQRDIAFAPAVVAERLATFLDLGDQQAANMEEVFRTQRPQQTAALEEQAPSLEAMGWTVEQREAFIEECAEAMRLFGYCF